MDLTVSVSTEAAGMTGHQNECKLDLAPLLLCKIYPKQTKKVLKTLNP